MVIPSREEIKQAASRVAPHVRRTPVMEVLGSDLGLDHRRVVLKLEALQVTGSFKPRGAFNRVLSSKVPTAGLIAASGGNHGLAVAWVGAQLGVATEIYVPDTVPAVKEARLRELGATVCVGGAEYDEARRAAAARARESGALSVHAYDHPDVVAGAGTVGRELEEQIPGVDTVLVAVGGGGLIAGVAAWGRGRFRTVAVEPESCPTYHAALDAGAPIDVDVSGIAADSLGARRLGDIAYEVLAADVASLIVPDAAILEAQRVLWRRLRIVAEPGGAAALGALLSGAHVPDADECVAVVVCGSNAPIEALVEA